MRRIPGTGRRSLARRAPGAVQLICCLLRDKKRFAHFTGADDGAIWLGPTSIHEQVTRPELEQTPFTGVDAAGGQHNKPRRPGAIRG